VWFKSILDNTKDDEDDDILSVSVPYNNNGFQ